MECRFCNTQNPEQAVFCKRCGKRLDGTTLCPSCGGQISADDAFCIFCGANVKTAPAFIADETAIAAAAGTADAPVANGVSESGGQTAKKVLNYVANGTAILTAVLALIFVFFIGVTATMSISVTSQTTTALTYDIKYFFKDGYEQLDKLKDLVKDYNSSNLQYGSKYPDFYVDANYAPLIFGTLIFVATIISVIVLAITAIVRCTKNMLGNKQMNGCNYALATFLTFIFGATMLMGMTNGSIHNYSANIFTIKFTPATLSCIIIGAISSFCTFGCKIASRGRALLNKSEALKYCFSAGAIVLCAVMLGLSSASFFKIKVEDISFSVSLISMITFLSSMCSTQARYESIKNCSLIAALLIISFIILIIIAALLVECLIRNGQNMQDGKTRTTLDLHVALVCLSAVLLTFTVIIVHEFGKAIDYLGGFDEDYKFTYAIPIVILVFSILSLVENIVYRVMSSRTTNAAIE